MTYHQATKVTKMADSGDLQLEYIFGFEGNTHFYTILRNAVSILHKSTGNLNISGGIIVHPDGHHLIYSLGSTLIVKNLATNEQSFLHGHTNDVSCISVSQSGHYIASGQSTHMGFKV